jgi:nicotinamidase-related amidase
MTNIYDRHTAVVLVDPYDDLLADNGALWPRLQAVAESVGLREHLVELVHAARDTQRPVFYAPHRRWRPGDVERWEHAAPVHQHLRDPRLFQLGTPGAQWYPPLAPRSGEIVASEHWGMSGFAGTDLDQLLRQHGVHHIVLAGLTAPGCVEGTGRYAAELGYSVTLVTDAVAAFTEEYQHAAVELTGPLYAVELAPAADVVERF